MSDKASFKRQLALGPIFPRELSWDALERHSGNSEAVQALEEFAQEVAKQVSQKDSQKNPAAVNLDSVAGLLRTLGVCGDIGSGKTWLARLWSSSASAHVLRGGENFWERAAFQVEQHPFLALDDPPAPRGYDEEQFAWRLLERVKDKNGAMLICASAPPISWDIQLDDLRTRLVSVRWITMRLPDDRALKRMLREGLKENGFDGADQLSDELLRYVLDRMERSYLVARLMPPLISEQAFANKGRVTKPVLQRALGIMQDILQENQQENQKEQQQE